MIVTILLVLSALPLGYLLAWLAREELVIGRRWFQRLVLVSLVFGGGLWAYGIREGFTLWMFLAILAFVAYHQSYDRRWTKSKI